MARLNDHLDSDDELPDLFSILRLRTEASIRTHPKTPRPAHGDITYREKEGKELATEYSPTERHVIASETFTNVHSDRRQPRKQRPLRHLKQAHVNSLLLPPSDASVDASVNSPKHKDGQSIGEVDGVSDRASPKRLTNGLADRLGKVSADTVNRIDHDDSFSTDLSGFIVPDSATDGESPVTKSPKKKKKKKKQKQKQKQKQKYRSPKISIANLYEPGFQEAEQPQLCMQQLSGKSSLALPDKRKNSRTCLESLPSSEHLRSELVEAHPSLDKSITL